MSIPAFTAPYPASWFNRYLDWVDRLPIPVWLYYIFLYLLGVLFLQIPTWLGGDTPYGQFTLERVIGGFWIVFESGTIHYLDKVGKAQMEKFRPLLKSDDSFEDLHYRIHRMPARPIFIITALLGAVILLTAFLDPTSYGPEGSSPMVIVATAIILFIEYTTSPVYLYHAIHQLGVVRKAYALSGEISIFNLGGLRSLSVISARTGSALFLLFVLNYVQNIFFGEQRDFDRRHARGYSIYDHCDHGFCVSAT